jgi:uncharacterized protein
VSIIETADLVTEIETVFIPLSDGRSLAARLFLPRTADAASPVPAILEYIPYRRRDGTRSGDEAMHRWFAAHGYACARVDIAGTGDSDGVVEGEYVAREQADGVEVIAWLAAQPWCTGAVGMIGISWGGFNGLQIAAEQPPALKAVISLCSVVNRYDGDVHYTGGCLNEENLEWGAYFFSMQAFPPDPAIVGVDRWRTMWRERIDAAVVPPAEWLSHQRYDDYWRQGSIDVDYSRVEIPVLAVSGWADGYTPAVPAIVENLGPHARGILGPWGHKYPQDGIPGPAIGFLAEATRWWDHWLRGDDRVVDGDPLLRVWLQDPQRPAPHVDERAGRWIALDRWPSGASATSFRCRSRALLTDGGAEGTGGADEADPSTRAAGHWVDICSPVTTGLAAGQWCAYGLGKIAPELATDQRHDDAGSLVYDSAVLDTAVDLVGSPTVHLRVRSDRPVGQIAVRVSAVHPDGAVERLTYGIANLCHRDGHEDLAALPVDEPVDVDVTMRPVAHRIPAGYRLRFSISTGYWPMIWPSPALVTLSVDESVTRLALPILTEPAADAGAIFGSPEQAATGSVTALREGVEARRIVTDLASRRTTFIAERDDGEYVLDDIGTVQTFTRVRSSSIVDDDPLSATATVTSCATYRRDDWDVRIDTEVTQRCDADRFYIDAHLVVHEGDREFARRSWSHVIDRDHL